MEKAAEKEILLKAGVLSIIAEITRCHTFAKEINHASARSQYFNAKGMQSSLTTYLKFEVIELFDVQSLMQHQLSGVIIVCECFLP